MSTQSSSASPACVSNSYAHSSVTFVGSICIFYFLLRILTALRKLFLRESYDLAKRYGTCTWALITGATSPTGNGLSYQLAKQGFNLILVGRDTNELQKMRDVMTSHYTVKVRIVVADFREAVNLSFYSDIMRQIEDLDISIVVHGVGMAAVSEKFHQLPMEKSHQCLVVNMFSPVLLSHQVIPRMLQRYHKSAIVVVGGENAKQPIPGMSVSSGCKAFLKNFSIAASVEYEEKIDIFTVQPFGVRKQQVQDENAPQQSHSVFVIDSERFAKSTLRQLGHERTSSGDWIHQFLSWCYSLLPSEVALQFWGKILSPREKREEKKSKRESDEFSILSFFKRKSQ